jgi:hypothetical protein
MYTSANNGGFYLHAAEWLDVRNTLNAKIEDRHI